MLIMNGIEMPEPKVDGFKVVPNKIWSKNAGRAADGSSVGDIVAIKYKLFIEWAVSNPEDVKKIDSVVSNKDLPYFPVTFIDPHTNEAVTRTFYAGDPSYPVHTYVVEGVTYKGVSVNLIE